MKQEELTTLLNKMTIDEKIGQMVQVVGSEFLEEKKNVVTGPENNQKSISKKMLYNVGSILNTAGAENIKKIQDEYLSKSRLKIPLLFMADIINIHGQQDNQNLLNPSKHITYLDDFVGNKMHEIKIKYEELYKKYNEINLQLSKNYGDDKEKERRLDLLNYQLEEIVNAK